MRKPLVALLLMTALLGQGCFELVPRISTIEPTGTPSPEGIVTFTRGFGLIPGHAPRPEKLPGPKAIVKFKLDIPHVPNAVTVIRQHASTPNTVLLQNITTALRIPGGTLQTTPVTDELFLAWREETGFRWSYDARENVMAFDRMQKSREMWTSKSPSDTELIAAALLFLDERGIDRDEWGDILPLFSWTGWWNYERGEGRCLSESGRNAILRIAGDESTKYPVVPTLVKESAGHCVDPIFPNRQVVNIYKMQDEERVYDAAGNAVLIAQLVINASSLQVESGWFELRLDGDRSNYPAKSPDALANDLLQGGLSGLGDFTTADEIMITGFTTGLYEHAAEINGITRRFFIPVMRATGEVVHGSMTSPYHAIVPLLDENEYLNE